MKLHMSSFEIECYKPRFEFYDKSKSSRFIYIYFCLKFILLVASFKQIKDFLCNKIFDHYGETFHR